MRSERLACTRNEDAKTYPPPTDLLTYTTHIYINSAHPEGSEYSLGHGLVRNDFSHVTGERAWETIETISELSLF